MSSTPPRSTAPAWTQGFPGLAEIRDEFGMAALHAACQYRYPAGTPLMRHGDPCEAFILMSRGTARVFQSGEGGREIALFRVRAGDLCVLTLSDLIASRPYSANAIAEEDVEIVVIPAEQFRSALARSEAFRTFVLSSIAGRLCEIMGLVEQVAFQRLDLRLACLLGQLFGQRNTDLLEVTHQDLANELGTTREVVSRLLKEFENTGCIRLRRGEIQLLSSETLLRLSCASP